MKCNLTAFGDKYEGYGMGLTVKKAMQRSFGEAWERSMLFNVNQQGQEKIYSSNGMAAANSVALAKKLAKEELIERELMLQAWTQQRGWVTERVAYIARMILLSQSKKGWNFKYYKISHKQHSVLVGVGVHEKYGVVFDSAYCKKSKVKTQIKMAMSLVTTANYNSAVDSLKNYVLPKDAPPEAHFTFYRQPKNITAVNFLKNFDSKIALELPDDHFLGVQVNLLSHGFDMPYVARAWKNNFIKLCWGTQCIQGVNKWPHPLA